MANIATTKETAGIPAMQFTEGSRVTAILYNDGIIELFDESGPITGQRMPYQEFCANILGQNPKGTHNGAGSAALFKQLGEVLGTPKSLPFSDPEGKGLKDKMARAATEKATKPAGTKAVPKVAKVLAAGNGAKAPKAKREASPDGLCMCGCGDKVTSRFLPGHDSRLHSRMKKYERGEIKNNEMNAAEQRYAREHGIRAGSAK